MNLLLKYSIIAAIFVSPLFAANKDKTDGYETNNLHTLKIIQQNTDHAFVYSLLRRAEEVGDRDFRRSSIALWSRIKQHDFPLQSDLAAIVNDNWDFLSDAQQKRALGLDLVMIEETAAREPHFWDRCSVSIGPALTSALKVGAALSIFSFLVVMPVAAAVVTLPGGYMNSCKNIHSESFHVDDPNLQGVITRVRADCLFDREAHGLRHNEILIPPDIGACSFLQNNNGTLVLSDAPGFVVYTSAENELECPSLEGSFLKTCKILKSEPYKSSDPRIPAHAYCTYELSCAGNYYQNIESEILLSRASAKCTGKALENCDGQIVVRATKGDDHQCDTHWPKPKPDL